MKLGALLQWLVVGALAGAAIFHQPLSDWLRIRQLALHPRFLAPPIAGSTLCVGDSTAFGVGVAAGEAWPDRLANVDGARVYRAIAPRLHSGDALRQLPQWLHVARPERIVILVGSDDAAIRPAVWAEHERVLLGVWLERELEAESTSIDMQQFAGRWRLGRSILVLHEDSTASIDEKRGSWRIAGPTFYLGQDGQGQMSFRWHFEGQTLVLRNAGGLQAYLTPEDLSLDPSMRISRALSRGHWFEAELRIDSSRTTTDTEAFSHELATLLGQRPDRRQWPTSYSQPTSLSAEQAATLEQNLRDCAQLARRAGATIVFVGHAPALSDRTEITRRVAEQLGAGFVAGATDGLAGAPAYPTSRGHAALAERLGGGAEPR